ncbi:MAG TPA: DUF4235 domain-containing protein [Streptosporangiaceae bacterium]|jgi:Protein of unknown function (DUF4235)|nr:DUF4235 domain-containing protein [Streptosporangiaceae bacterium]
MSGKKADGGNRLINGVAGFVAAFGARRLLHFAWKQVTGKEPPEHPEDPQVALGEALAWGVLIAAGVAIARLLATRVAIKRIAGPGGDTE